MNARYPLQMRETVYEALLKFANDAGVYAEYSRVKSF